jgi:hypothetical protein
MEDFATTVADTTMIVIICVIIVTSLCAIKLSLCTSIEVHQKFNKHVVPGFPCEGTLFILATDGVLYMVPKQKAVVKTDMVREVHCGRVARSCDQHGNFAYFEHDEDHRRHEHNDERHAQLAVDHIHNNWSVGSPGSQDRTVSVSDDDSVLMSPQLSPLAGEALTDRVQMI